MTKTHIRSARQTFFFSARFALSLFDYRDVHVVFNVVLLGQKRLLDLRGGTLPRKRLFWTYTWMWRLISLTSRTLSPAKACIFSTIRGSILCDSSATCERKDNFNKYGIQSSGKMHWWLIPNHVFGPDTNITYLPWKMICVVALSCKFNVDSPLPSRLSSCKLFFLLVFFPSRLFPHFILLVPFLFLGVTVTFHAMLAVTYFSPNDDKWTSVKLYPGISSRRTFEVNFVFFRLLTSCLLKIRTYQGHI